jgi:hypothetical protein
LPINPESPCISHIYRLSLPVSKGLYCLLLCSFTSCASNWVNVLTSSLFWALNRSLGACEHCILLLFLCPDLKTLYTNRHAT